MRRPWWRGLGRVDILLYSRNGRRMKIRRIEIVGFKSFVDKTVLVFDAGISAVLGPNGCGKSNLVDALRWVMGEQNAKNLRGQVMEDVLFGGSDSRRPHGLAEVSLVFSHSAEIQHPLVKDFNEIMVTRRLYRNGESEYLINRASCRLMDVTELFMDTGIGARAYSIIEQGKIGSILHALPEQRRSLIEEAAGITKYKARKKAALRKIEATRQNLVRLGDLIGELERQLGSLQLQAERAEQYRRVRRELRALELLQACHEWRRLEAAVQDGCRAEQELQLQLTSHQARIDQLQLQLEKILLQRAEAEQQLQQLQQQVLQHRSDAQQCDNDMRLLQQQQQNLQRQRQEGSGELQQASQRQQLAERRLQELTRQLDDLGRQARCAQEDWQQHQQALQTDLELDRQQGVALQTARQQWQQANQELLQRRTAWARLEQQQTTAAETVQRQQVALDALQQQGTQQRQTLAALQAEVEQLRQARQLSEQQQQQALCQRDQQRQQVQRARQVQQQVAAELNLVQSRHQSLHELVTGGEDVGADTRALLADSQLCQLGVALLADGLQVPAELEEAVAVALEQQLQAVAFDSVAGLATLLEQHDLPGGRLQLPRPALTLARAPAGVPLSDCLVGDSAVAAAWLNGVWLVESLWPFLDQPLAAGLTLVTKRGDSLCWRGRLVLAGPQSTGQLLRNRRRLTELAQQVDQLRQQLERETAQVESQQRLRDTAEQQLQHWQQQLQQLQLQLRGQEKELELAQRNEQQLGQRLERQRQQLHQARQQRDRLQEQEQQEQAVLVQLEAHCRELQQQIDAQEQQWQQQRQQLQQAQQQLAGLQEQAARAGEQEKALQQERQREQRILAEQQQRQRQWQQRLATLEQQQAQQQTEQVRLQQRLEVLLTQLQRDEERLVRQQQQAGDRRAEGDAAETALRQLRSAQQQLQQELVRQQGGVERLRQEQQALRQRMEERQPENLAQLAAAALEPLPLDADRRLRRLRESLEGFGEVNLLAIDEYAALNQRYSFLAEQRQDLETSINDLQAAIQQINRTSRRRFREAFDQINACFQEIFPRLFAGGRAALQLTDETDLLETGVDIIAQPPGKKLQNVMLLSGGEKALTAVALIFAIFQVKPSPFCVLDEVDAPLDEANIGRFNDMVREIARQSQVILITHNPRTMEIADQLFGVTMEEPGVSRLVSVRLSSLAPEMRGQA